MKKVNFKKLIKQNKIQGDPSFGEKIEGTFIKILNEDEKIKTGYSLIIRLSK